MGLRGRAPKPTVIEIAEGFPGKRGINQREPKPTATRPKMPEQVRLDPIAAREWRRMAPMLERMRVLTEADGAMLGNLCIDYSLLQQAQDGLRKSGMLIKHPETGHIHQNPLVAIVRSQADAVNRTLREFGMSPSSRSRIQTREDNGADTLERALTDY